MLTAALWRWSQRSTSRQKQRQVKPPWCKPGYDNGLNVNSANSFHLETWHTPRLRFLILCQFHLTCVSGCLLFCLFHHPQHLIIFQSVSLRSFSATFLSDTELTREVVVGEICHFAYTDRESPKYWSTVDERFCDVSVIPCHTYHSHVWVFCLPHLHFS